MRLPSSRSLAVPIALALLALPLGACGSEDPTPASSGSDDVTASDAPTTGATEPTDVASETPYEVTETPSASPVTLELDDRLIPAEDLPGLNELTSWMVNATALEDGVPHGACQKTSLVDIGAQSSVFRTYAGGEGVTAVQVVGEFADDKSAWRAHQVLKTWTTKCADVLDADVEKVGALAPVAVDGGAAQSALVQYGDDADELHTFAGIAIVRRGPLLSLVQIDVLGQDYNYEPGQEPAALAVPVAAARLG